MNWLAHLHLSEPTVAFRLGSLLPDLVSKPELAALPEIFKPGITRHLQIDIFTDSHPVFRRSISRLQPPYRKFRGILIDIFYDHFLASHWDFFSQTPLPKFAADIYQGFEQYRNLLPDSTQLRLQRMQNENWLCSYCETAGIALALGRVGRRLRQPVDLTEAVSLLETNYHSLYDDFSAFYPELQKHVLHDGRS
jgi:acyl carrier protein phosphodiesterase